MNKSLFAISTLLISILGYSATITVDDDGPADFTTIQAAIDAAAPSDVVILQPGTYTGNGNRDIDFLGKAITVQSTDPQNLSVVASTIIDCEGTSLDPHRGFIFQSGEGPNTLLSGLSITHGNTEDGCGIYITDSSPSITHCVITENSNIEYGSNGGGIFCLRGSPIISYCSIINNTNRDGGAGIYLSGQGPSDCLISNCIIKNNTATFRAGGGLSSNTNLVLENCTISDNSANYSGGGAMITGHAVVKNCLIAKNISNYDGGGLYLSGNVLLRNNTIANNESVEYGGGTHLSLVLSSEIELINTILWENTSGNGNQISMDVDDGVSDAVLPPEEYGSTLKVSYSDVQGGQGDVYLVPYSDLAYLLSNEWEPNNIDTDPNFVDPSTSNFHLRNDSPCIDAGDPSTVPEEGETDIDGHAGVFGGIIDIGADEKIDTPYINCSSKYVTFFAKLNRPNPADQTLTISNIGGGTLNWTISESCDWLTVVPMSGSCIYESNTVTLQVDSSGLAVGPYSCVLTVSGPNAENSPQIVTVNLTVADSTITVDDDGPADFSTIQAAIDLAVDGDIIVVEDGIYTGPGNWNIDFQEKK